MRREWSDEDVGWMKRALALAARGRGRVEPNPMVGAVLVKGGRVVGEGYHRRFGGPHAEVYAVRQAGGNARGATLYVTLEPCDHFGKTPPCTDLLISAGIASVVGAMEDPDERVSGNGFRKLRQAGMAVQAGLLEAEARSLNAPYIKLRTRGLPYVTAKWAMTLDGRIASETGDSKWVTGEEARRHAHQTRNQADAVLVGIGTVLRDDPLLTCRLPRGRNPRRIVLDSRARLPLDSRLVRSVAEAEVIVATIATAPRKRIEALRAAGCTILKVCSTGGRCSVADLVRQLGRMQVTNLMVESGEKVLSAFFKAGQVDRVMAYISPKLLGDGLSPLSGLGLRRMNQALQLEEVSIRRLGSDVLVTGTVRVLS
jgi:diaminohydroxyphosphoribosylaminopyrimidine deaminase/5-amino-6-(5-phosphoribosylamino)uracil reductase